jgi:ATP-dependent DNA helicase PIF1
MHVNECFCGHYRHVAKKIIQNSECLARWLSTKVLIIDEISMLDVAVFDLIGKLAKALRKNTEPWGGIQVILSGDFFQLPPIVKVGHDESVQNNKSYKSHFCFDAESWNECIPSSNIIQLTQIFRQTDQEFIDCLNELRRGICSDSTMATLKPAIQRGDELGKKNQGNASSICSFSNEFELTSTYLLPRKLEVEEMNKSKLAELVGEELMFESEDSSINASYADQLNQLPVSKKLVLKIGAQVMLLKNSKNNDNLCNGSRGVVISFSNNKKYPVVKFSNGIVHTVYPEKWSIKIGSVECATRTAIPLSLAYAITINKAQGMTLDHVNVSLKGVFEVGQVYVALSRAKSLNGLTIHGFRKEHVKAHPAVVEFYESMEKVNPFRPILNSDSTSSSSSCTSRSCDAK